MPAPRRRPRVAGIPATGRTGTSHRAGKSAGRGSNAGRSVREEETRGTEARSAEARSAEARSVEPQEAEAPVTAEETTQVLPEEISTASAIARGEPERAVRSEQASESEPVTEHEGAAAAEAGRIEPDDGEPDVTIAGSSRGWALPASLIALAVVLAAFAVFAGLRWSEVRGATDNTALTDSDTTNQVTTEVSNALNTLLTFDYKQPNKSDQAARNLIDGKLGDCGGSSDKVGYDKLMSVLKSQGPAQQLTLKSTVLKAGVQQLQGDRAEMLVLLDQQYSKGSGSSAKQSQAVVGATVQAVNKGGHWKLRSLCLQ